MERTSGPHHPSVARPRRPSGGTLAEWRAHAAVGALLRELRLLREAGVAAPDDAPLDADARRLLELLRVHGPCALDRLPSPRAATTPDARTLAARLAARGLVALEPAPASGAAVARLTSRGEHYLLDGGLPGIAGLLTRLRDLTPEQLESAVRVLCRVREAASAD